MSNVFQNQNGANEGTDGPPDCPCLEFDASKSERQKLNISDDICNNINSTTLIPNYLLQILCTDVYGYGCAKHELSLELPCNKTDTGTIQDLCNVEWCYVDHEKCFGSNHSYIQDQITGLYLSYSTCSPVTKEQMNFRRENSLQGKVIDVVVPDVEKPYFFKEEENSTSYTGAIPEYLDQLKKLTGVKEFRFVFSSGASNEKWPESKYDAAIFDVTRQISGLAAGNFWITANRLKNVRYTVPIYSSQFYLYELEKIGGGFIYNASQALRPFTFNLWLVTVFILVFIACMKVFLSNERGDNSNWHQAFRNRAWKTASTMRRIVTASQVCMDATVETCIEYFSSSTTMSGESMFARKILIFGFGFFILVVCSSYTANLASFLTKPALMNYVSTIDEAIEKEKTICAQALMREFFEGNEGWKKAKMKYLRVPQKKYVIEASRKLKNKECHLFIAEGALVDQIEETDEFCDIKVVSLKNTVHQVDWAFPVQVQYSTDISRAIIQGALKGYDFGAKLAIHKSSLECAVYVGESSIENAQIRIDQMILPLFVLSVFICFAICAKSIKFNKWFTSYRKLQDDEIENGSYEDNTIKSLNEMDSNDRAEYKCRLELIKLDIMLLQHQLRESSQQDDDFVLDEDQNLFQN